MPLVYKITDIAQKNALEAINLGENREIKCLAYQDFWILPQTIYTEAKEFLIENELIELNIPDQNETI